MPNDESMKYDPIAMLRARLTEDFNQSALADEMGISDQYLSEILRQKRPPSERILEFLGLERVVTYRPKPAGEGPKKTRARRR